jgi:hypothetical protein
MRQALPRDSRVLSVFIVPPHNAAVGTPRCAPSVPSSPTLAHSSKWKGQDLPRDLAPELGVGGLSDLAHAARSAWRVWGERSVRRQTRRMPPHREHRVRPIRRTVMQTELGVPLWFAGRPRNAGRPWNAGRRPCAARSRQEYRALAAHPCDGSLPSGDPPSAVDTHAPVLQTSRLLTVSSKVDAPRAPRTALQGRCRARRAW